MSGLFVASYLLLYRFFWCLVKSLLSVQLVSWVRFVLCSCLFLLGVSASFEFCRGLLICFVYLPHLGLVFLPCCAVVLAFAGNAIKIGVSERKFLEKKCVTLFYETHVCSYLVVTCKYIGAQFGGGDQKTPEMVTERCKNMGFRAFGVLMKRAKKLGK